MTRSFRIGLLLAGGLMLGCGSHADGPNVEKSQLSDRPAGGGAPPAVPTAPSETTAEFQLRLQPGMTFPVRKTVRQSLVQGSATELASTPITGLSELVLWMGVTVAEVTPEGRIRLHVRYDRVRYGRDVDSHRFEYDSATEIPVVDAEAAVYAGMAGDGFDLWIGPDHELLEEVGFDEFLERCLGRIPSEHRDAIANRIAETSGDESLANFVEDSIGLLPFRLNHGSVAAVGDQWRRDRRLVRPIRLFLGETCTLAALGKTTADIDVVGTIAASQTFDPVDEEGGEISVLVRGGHSFGHCRTDLATGLPIESRLERLIEMRVRLADGREFDQVKRVETLIEMFPRQPVAKVLRTRL